MGDETRYLEGQYDGSGLQRSVQHMGDLLQAHEMEQEVKEVQQNLWEREEGRIAQIYGVSETDGDGLGKLLEAYAEEDKYNEYLVDGAVLTCDQATLEPFPLPDGGEIVLEPDPVIYPETRRLGVLRVEENLMSVNGKIYATVGDTVKDVNVMPFRCNCRQKVNRDEEEKRIKGDPECGKYGVCRHLMQLNEKWDNMPRTTGYMKLRNALSYDTAGVADVLDSEMGVAGEEGITMTSVLFCKHGGLIRAVTSGQEEVIVREETDTDENESNENEVTENEPDNYIVTGVSDQLIELLKSYETGADQNGELLPQGQPALRPYHGKSDPANSFTIGWGHYMDRSEYYTYQDENGNEVTVDLYDPKTVITLEQAEAILAADIAEREETINSELENRGVCENVNQQFYDALFSLYYQMGSIFSDTDFQSFLDSGHFDPDVYGEEIINNFGEYSSNREHGTMKRRADELDIIFHNEYERNDDFDEVNRYGENIWGILTRKRNEQGN